MGFNHTFVPKSYPQCKDLNSRAVNRDNIDLQNHSWSLQDTNDNDHFPGYSKGIKTFNYLD